MAVKSVSVRIEEEMLKKISYVADYEGRSINSHILVLIRNSVKQFEEDNGKIEIDRPIERDENVKPAAFQRAVGCFHTYLAAQPHNLLRLCTK